MLAHLACISASWACTTECHKKTSACTYHILQTGQNGHTLQTGFPVEDQHVHNHPCLSDPVRKEIQREFRTNLGGERFFAQELENSAGSKGGGGGGSSRKSFFTRVNIMAKSYPQGWGIKIHPAKKQGRNSAAEEK